MHEMSLCESILQIVEEQAEAQSFKRVRRVRLEIGALAGIENEAMHFGFDVVTRGTVAHEAVLEILDLPGRAWCMECAREVQVSERYDACPECGGYQLQVTGGDEMRIKDLEVE